MDEAHANAADIRTFAAEGHFQRELAQSIKALADARRRMTLLSGAVTPLYQTLGLLLIVGVIAGLSALEAIDPVRAGAVALLS